MLAETPLIVPAGMAKGCNPRVRAYGKVAGIDKLEDRIELIPEDEWQERCNKILMRQYVKEILS